MKKVGIFCLFSALVRKPLMGENLAERTDPGHPDGYNLRVSCTENARLFVQLWLWHRCLNH